MLFSEFSPFGHFAFSGRIPKGQRVYESMRESLGGNYAEDRGGIQMARLYAQAMGIASALYTLERAGNNAVPRKTTELLAEAEREWGIIPAPTATLKQRRSALAARRLLPRGARREAIENALLELLGADFVAYFGATTPPHITWGGEGVGNFAKPGSPRKLVRIVAAIAAGLGAPQTVTYAPLRSGDPLPDLLPGEQLCVDPGVLPETVVISARDGEQFTATFTKPHDPNTVATTQLMPFWGSSARINIVQVSSAAAASPAKRQQINDLMRRMLRGVSTWHIVDQSGPFTVGVGKLGITPIG